MMTEISWWALTFFAWVIIPYGFILIGDYFDIT